jgi:hypothetical protein
LRGLHSATARAPVGVIETPHLHKEDEFGVGARSVCLSQLAITALVLKAEDLEKGLRSRGVLSIRLAMTPMFPALSKASTPI